MVHDKKDILKYGIIREPAAQIVLHALKSQGLFERPMPLTKIAAADAQELLGCVRFVLFVILFFPWNDGIVLNSRGGNRPAEPCSFPPPASPVSYLPDFATDPFG